jgi:CheY-like chemotaxis protein/MinD-like ATPase involved in chromosome partitioning or flagellar assembly
MSERILIVDDDIDTLRLVGMMLESEGFDIIAANNGQRAISLARTEVPDLIILDIMMPEIDGYAVTRQLRQERVTRSIPILIFTAKTGMDDKMLGLELGADVYLTKPISTRELLTQVNKMLSPLEETDQPILVHKAENVLAITAVKGGMGVSTAAVNLGIALFRMTEKSVIVSDFRPGQGSLALDLGYENPDGFNKLLELPPEDLNPQLIEDTLVDHNSGIRLLLSSAYLRDAKYNSRIENFEIIARYLPQLADYIILDLDPGMTNLNLKVLPHCSDVVLIVEPAPQSVSKSNELIKELSLLGINHDHIKLVIFNRIHSALQLSFGEVEEQLNLKIASAFSPNRELANEASIHHIPFIILKPEGLTSQQINQLASSIIN